MTGIALLPESKKRLDLTAASEKLFSQDFFGRILFFDEKSAVIYAKTAADRIKSPIFPNPVKNQTIFLRKKNLDKMNDMP